MYTCTCSSSGLRDNFDYLFNEVNAGLKVKAEIDERPLNSFHLVLFLLQDEHGVVEQLLQLLVGVVDAKLLK